MVDREQNTDESRSPNLERFVAWLMDYAKEAEGIKPDERFVVFLDGTHPEEVPVVEGEQVYAAYGRDFYLSPLAIFVRQKGSFVRIRWAHVTELFHNHLKAGYVWQFRTSDGKQYDYCWGNLWELSGPYAPFSDVVEECIQELGAKACEKTRSEGHPIWDVSPDLRYRERWFRDYLEPRYPELVAPLRATYAAYDEVCSSGILTPEQLRPILECARSHRGALYENATQMLAHLTEHYPDARDAVTEMANAKSAKVRFNAVISLSRNTPREFTIELIRKFLSDRSSRVRTKAADWSLTLQIAELVPELEQLCATETHAETRKTVDYSLRLLRDGYILKPNNNNEDGYNITVQNEGDSTGRFVSREEFDEKGLEAIIQELQHRR